MGRLLEFATTMGLFIGILEANIACEPGNATCENSPEAVSTDRSYTNQTLEIGSTATLTEQKLDIGSTTAVTDRPLDLGCTTTEEVPFCWWAIEVGASKWTLFTNGMSSLLEYNIRPFCINVNEFYGFSFTNKIINLHHFDKTISISERQSAERQILVDMFYFCCSQKENCSPFLGNISANVIIDKLTDMMLPHVIMSNDHNIGSEGNFCFGDDGREMVLLPGVDVCIFVADSSTKVKIYSGPMMFNHLDMISHLSTDESSLAALTLKRRLCLSTTPRDDNYGKHLKHGECLTYLSKTRYLLFCCCYFSPYLCSYAIDYYTESYQQYNRYMWMKNMKLKTVRNVRTKYGESVAARSWIYRDFFYSIPRNRQGTLTPAEDNWRLWHCAFGERLFMRGGVTKGTDLKKLYRTQVQARASSCHADLIINFQKSGNSRIVASGAITYGNSNEICGKMRCRIIEPICVDNLVNDNNGGVTLKVRCCCGTHNLCNREADNFNRLLQRIQTIGPIGECAGGVYSHFVNVLMGDPSQNRIFCLHYISFRDAQERYLIHGETFYIPVAEGKHFAEQYFENTTKVRFKIIVVLPLYRPGCEILLAQQITQLGVAYCSMEVSSLSKGQFCDADYRDRIYQFMTKAELPICESGSYNVFPGFVSGGTRKISTAGSPLCINDVHVIDDDGSLEVISEIFDPMEPWQYLRYVEPHISFGRHNLVYNLLPRIMTYFARWDAQLYGEHPTIVQRSPRPLSLCETSNGDVECATAMGCFLYRSFDGRKPLMGCIEDIPSIHEAKPELRAVLDCRTMLWSNDENICNAIVDAARFNGTAGVLCCCQQKCPAPLSNSPTSDAHDDGSRLLLSSSIRRIEMAVSEIVITQKSVEMLRSRAQIAEAIAKNQILSGTNNEQIIASAIKRRFDDLYGPSWQCIVGKSFGCYITHKENHFLYFYVGDFAVLLYKNN